MRQASGALDADVIKQEGERLLASVRELLTGHSTQVAGTLSSALKQYFDPASGDLPQRLERLVRKDGELEALLGRHLDGDASTLARILARHLGDSSPLLRVLSPTQSDGLLGSIREAIQRLVESQRDQILRQFSLDDKGSALSRLVMELTGANGRLREDFSKDLAWVRDEFSLDNSQGALSRLVERVEKAQRTISEQFSRDNEGSALSQMSRLLEATNARIGASLTLDDDKSPLYRLRRELSQVIKELENSNKDFQAEVRATLDSFRVRREEAARSTRHGEEFEDLVGSMLQREAQRLGDIYESTGKTVGSIRNSKVGDHLIILGPDSAAQGARIVCEAKEDKSYDTKKAQSEICLARENRKAQAGIFVFSKATVPEGMELFARFGADVLVVWDRDDAGSDVFLKAALSVARALVLRDRADQMRSRVDLSQIDRAIGQISKDAGRLAEIAKWAGTIKSNGQKILNETERLRENLTTRIGLLRDQLKSIKGTLITADDA